MTNPRPTTFDVHDVHDAMAQKREITRDLLLTSVDIPAPAIERVAVEMALARVAGRLPAQARLITPALTARFSTAAAAR